MSSVLVWIDLEMTGLNPEVDRIIEIATIVTDSELNIIEEGPNLAVHQSEEQLALMDSWNQRTHGASGLIERVRASTVTEEQAQEQTLAFIQRHCGPRSAPLAGNSVHQDRRFLARYMPEIEAYLHYRIVDVSTVKELTARWYPNTFVRRPSKPDTHEALSDIRGSIEELRFYRRAVFIGEDASEAGA